MSKKVFLGGTCNNSLWREELIPLLNIDYFNPVVKNWTSECMEEEIKQRNTCDFVLYVITPQMVGVYSIAEVIDDSNKRPLRTIFCTLHDYEGQEFTLPVWKSLVATGTLVVNNGGQWVDSLESVATLLNGENHK